MVKLTIDNREVEAPEGTTILDAAKTAGIFLPTLCFLEGVNDIGTCRVCLVEVEGAQRLVTSCNTHIEEGMVVYTNSQRAREARKVNVELILSQHDASCASCVRSQTCALQTLSNDLGIIENVYKKNITYGKWDRAFPLIRHESKCIKCMRCVQVCNNMQQIGVWDSINSGSRVTVGIFDGRKPAETHCVLCGQCITHCPVGALRERDDTDRAFEAIGDPNKITVLQIAPAVRAAWGESLGLAREDATIERLVTALRRIGFDYIYDTSLTADLTVIEEGREFIELLKEGDESKFPLLTSCCPGWVRFLKSNYPDMLPLMSTAKSPQQMFGVLAKTVIARQLGVDPSNIFCVSVMPCIAKKSECDLPTMKNHRKTPDVDIVLTTREIDRMIRACHINPTNLEKGEFDLVEGFGFNSGAGVIFGATGGVMEAALRSVYYLVTGETPDLEAFYNIRGDEGWREATFQVSGMAVNVAIISGIGNARKLVEAIKSGEAKYHFVEVMTCPGGCAGGGGQPIKPNRELAEERKDNLYYLDRAAAVRFSHENPSIMKLYENNPDISYGLHTNHFAWDMPKNPFR